jgi:hypothetical protein
MTNKIFGKPVDFNNNDTFNFKAENVIALPTLGVGDSGRIVFHSGLNTFYGWTGTAWVAFN